MPFWDRWFRGEPEPRAETEIMLDEKTTDQALLTALLGPGDTITRDLAVQIPAVAACVNLISSTIAGLPVRLYDKGGKLKEIEDDPRLVLLNHDTGDTMTANQFWQAMIADYLLGKGGFAYIQTSGGVAEKIYYVSCDEISYVKNVDPIFKSYDLMVQGKKFYPWKFLKILRHTKDGVTGLSICDENPTLLSVVYKSLIYEKNLVARGGNKRGFLESERTLTEKAFQKLKEAFRRLYSSSDENVIVLNNGVKFKEASNTSVEMQLNENKRTNAEEICEIFGVPVSMISGGATADDKKVFVRTIANILSDIESSLNRDLLTEEEKLTKYFAFDTRELTRGDIKERYEAYKLGLEAHFLQVDEVREMEDLEPTGFKWMTIGLNDVLLDIKENTIYTPNTNALVSMDKTSAVMATTPNAKVGPIPADEERAYNGKNLLITGAPGSGKTTLAKEMMTSGDIIVDLDMIKGALLNRADLHIDARDLVPMLEVVRAAIYQGISEGKAPGKAYIITTQNDKEILNEWCEQLNADLHIMDTPKDVCIQRINDDDTRPDKEVFVDLVNQWFESGGDLKNES